MRTAEHAIAGLPSGEVCAMAEHIEGPLYYERMGRTGPVIAFVHPNPMDQSCWIFQMAHLSTWYRCIAIDIPGYGRSPKAKPGLTMDDMAQACWEAIDDAAPGERAILVGCSVGSALRALDASPAAEAHRRAGALGHRLQSRQGVHQAPHRVLPGTGHRLSLGLHLRGFEPGVPRDSAGALLCRHVHRAQRACRRAVDHLSVRGLGQGRNRTITIHASPAPRSF